MTRHSSVSSLSISILCLALAPTAGGAETVATIDGAPITRAEVEATLDAQLRDLDRQRQRAFEAGLEATIEARLLTLEAAHRGIDVDALVATEVDSKIAPVSEEEIDRFYQENSARIRQPKEMVAKQVESHLVQQRTVAFRRDLITKLRATYSVVNRLEPMRVEIPGGEAPERGPADAPVTLVAFSDFQCPACKSVAPVLDALQAAYPDRLRITFRQFPLEQIHPNARRAGQASLCAHEQGRFWDMHDALFADQRALGEAEIARRATDLGLDTEAFAACLAAGAQDDIIDADLRAGFKAGVTGTPSLFVNGRPVVLNRGSSPRAQLAAVIDDELARAGKR